MGRRVKSESFEPHAVAVAAIMVIVAATLVGCKPLLLRSIVEERVLGTGFPRILSVTPADGATGVDRRPEIVVTFNKAIDPATLTPDNLTIEDGANVVPMAIVHDDAAHTVTLVPEVDLDHLRAYFCRATTGIRDLVGNQLVEELSWVFTVRGWRWVPQVLLADDIGTGVHYPEVYFDNGGNAIGTWVDRNTEQIVARRFTRTDGWEPPRYVTETAAGSTGYPHVAFQSNTDAMLLWSDSVDGVNASLYSIQFSASSGWDPPFRAAKVYPPESNPHYFTSSRNLFAADGVDGFIAVFRDDSATNQMRSKYWHNDVWSTLSVISSYSGNTGYPTLAIGPGGSAVAAWARESDVQIYASYFNGSSWLTTEVSITGSTTPIARDGVSVASDAAGNAIAVWWEDTGSQVNVFANRYDASNPSWLGAGQINASSIGATVKPEIAMDPEGNATVVWTDYDDMRIVARRYAETAGWQPEVVLDGGTATYCVSPRIAVDPAGNVTVVWIQDQIHIYANRYNADTGEWSGPHQLDTQTGGSITFDRVSVDSDGNAFASWQQDNKVFVSRYD